MNRKPPPFFKKILEMVGFMGLAEKLFPPVSPTCSLHIECTNCGLVNPSAWKKCERCNAPLHAQKEATEDVDPPSLVEKI